ncbi:hypothetical protein [Mycobacteroides chelonae]|uniref:hypothetical protein n=1 Tax=Mycobacteroides chelonae TaxID=1774 RepID=UPI001F449EDB|nr:hypothetical protein [Mycobacteroides chelonae]UJW64570.1 hypothetical protein H0I67_17145 [Mycobacteroides chelonae]
MTTSEKVSETTFTDTVAEPLDAAGESDSQEADAQAIVKRFVVPHTADIERVWPFRA